jgi:hypothetical protein
MRILLDTNVLGRLTQPTHRMHVSAVSAVESLLQKDHELRLVPQVIYEFWAIATRSDTENGVGLTIDSLSTDIFTAYPNDFAISVVLLQRVIAPRVTPITVARSEIRPVSSPFDSHSRCYLAGKLLHAENMPEFRNSQRQWTPGRYEYSRQPQTKVFHAFLIYLDADGSEKLIDAANGLECRWPAYASSRFRP